MNIGSWRFRARFGIIRNIVDLVMSVSECVCVCVRMFIEHPFMPICGADLAKFSNIDQHA